MHRRSTHVPFIPTPAHKEIPDVEELVTPPAQHKDMRPEVVKPFENVKKSEFNQTYGSLRVLDGWQFVVDNFAKGTLTTIAATLVQSAVTFQLLASETRLLRWPGAVSLYLAIRSFAIAPTTATFATAGSIDLYYQDTIGGQTIPLGQTANNAALNLSNVNILIPTPITDAGVLAQAIGNLQATLNSGATVGAYQWQMAFSYAYMLPTNKPYDVVHIEDLLDAHPGYSKHR